MYGDQDLKFVTFDRKKRGNTMIHGFIYLTTNLINGKIYIGQRKFDKKGIYKSYIGSGRRFLKSVQKYGRENFKREILEYCTLEMIDDKERHYIDLYNSTNSDVG